MTTTKSMVNGDVESKEKRARTIPTFHNGNYEINYIAVAVLLLPLSGAIGALLYGIPVQAKTLLVALCFYIFNGLVGITMGYHRLYSHRAYDASKFVQWVCVFAGAGAFEGSAKWWGRNHRIHHRFVDTDADPYNAKRGFMFSHMGWMIMKQDYSLLGRVEISDLKHNPIVQFQHRYFFRMAMLSGIILPTLICGLGWGDWAGGYFYAALGKIVFVHHCTFFINSLAHSKFFWSTQTYNDAHTSRDSVVCALLTFGEGYHNYHHEFSNDYRNGIMWYHFDPTKWLIRTCAFFGAVRGLTRTPYDVIEASKCRMQAKVARLRLEEAERRLKEHQYPLLESWTMEDVQRGVEQGRKLLIVKGLVLDLLRPIQIGGSLTHKNATMSWYDVHPGGKRLLDAFVGKDATSAFSSEHAHRVAADMYIERMCVGRLIKA